MTVSFHAPRLARSMLALVAPLAFAACGGGISFGIGIGDGFDDFPPSVSIAAAVDTIQAGQMLTLVAAAADENGIDDVVFFRVDGGTFTALGSDGSRPYEWTTVVPTDGRTELIVFARARDNAGNTADSEPITIAVTP
jgi:hypothetical protein